MQVLLCRRDTSPIEASMPARGEREGFLRAIASGPSAARARSNRGFTLVELMITLAIAMVLLMIAVPSFRAITLSNRLTTTANDVVGAIQTARMEAVKRNANTQLCGSASNGTDTLGTKCTQIAAVYAMIDGAPTQIRDGTNEIVAPIVLTGDMMAVRFGGQGLGHKPTDTTPTPYSGLIADISTAELSTNNHRCINMTAGSILATTSQSAACK